MSWTRHCRHSELGYQAGVGVDISALTADLRYESNLSQMNPNFGQTQNLLALRFGFKILQAA